VLFTPIFSIHHPFFIRVNYYFLFNSVLLTLDIKILILTRLHFQLSICHLQGTLCYKNVIQILVERLSVMGLRSNTYNPWCIDVQLKRIIWSDKVKMMVEASRKFLRRRIIWSDKVKMIIIIIFINCNWVVTRWQWLIYM
jgi:hypothetical protein